jgi:exonuclease III
MLLIIIRVHLLLLLRGPFGLKPGPKVRVPSERNFKRLMNESKRDNNEVEYACICTNVQGYERNEVHMMMNEYKPLIGCLTETHCTEDIEDHELDIPGYSAVIRCDSHSRHTGGVLIYVRDGIKFESVNVVSCQSEYWAIEMKVYMKRMTVRLIVLYRSPSGSVPKLLEYLKGLSESNMIERGDTIICGDFNINWMNDSDFYVRKLKEWVNEEGMYQCVKDITRLTESSHSMIDLVITNVRSLKCEVGVTPIIGDHRPLFFIEKERTYESVITERKYVNWERYECLLKNEQTMISCDVNLDNRVNEFYKVTEDCLKQATTTRRVKSRHPPKPWFAVPNNGIKLALRERDECYKVFKNSRISGDENMNDLWIKYKSARNRAVDVIRRTRKKWLEENIDRMKNDPYRMWKTLKKLICKKKSGAINEIKMNDQIISDPREIVDEFNKYFINSLNELVGSIDRETVKWEMLPPKVDGMEFHTFGTIDLSTLMVIIKDMKSVWSVDGLNVNNIIYGWSWIGPELLDIIVRSLTEGLVPERWKLSTVVPIQKISRADNVSDFRPINMLPIVEKALEQIVLVQMREFVEKSECLSWRQSGFREKHSTETAIQLVIADWMEAIDERKVIGVIFLDLKRAFETIDRDRMLKKLECLGFGGTVLEWLRSYLYGRKQCTRVNEINSEYELIECGIPQGSKLGPLLFILYINDIVKVVKKCDIRLFADDTLIYLVGENAQEVCKSMNEDLQKVNEWMISNGLIVNVGKTKAMWINVRQRQRTNDSLMFGGQCLEVVNEYKYLGVYLDDRMNWKRHQDHLIKKLGRKVGVLCRLRQVLSIKTKTLVFNTIVLPHFNYCATITAMFNEGGLSVLQKIQNKAMRAILNVSRYESIRSMLSRLGWLNVRQMLTLASVTFVYKLEKGLLPKCFDKYRLSGSDVHGYDTRKKGNLRAMRVRSSRALAGVLHMGVRQFNALPGDVRGANTLSSFRGSVRALMCAEHQE